MTMIHGTCDPKFEKVHQAFAQNFTARGEVGAAVCIYKDGRKALDFWGGVANRATGELWSKDTIVSMMSVTKSLAAIALLRLLDRGLVALDASVATYWPDFAQSGKEFITIRHILSGTGGLMYVDHAPAGSALDWDVMITAIEKQEPEWPAGTAGAYHSVTQGFLLGEVVRRVDGRPINLFIQEEIADPLELDLFVGLNDVDIARVARIITNPASDTLRQVVDPSTKLGRAWRVMPAVDDFFNSDGFRRAVFPSGNGHSNARSIARLYASLANGGKLDGVHVLSRGLIEEVRKTAWDSACALTGRPYRYGLGFFLSKYPDTEYGLHFGPGRGAFGHPGAGGVIGFCDPEANISFGYSPNFMCAGAGIGDRCTALIDAMIECL